MNYEIHLYLKYYKLVLGKELNPHIGGLNVNQLR